MSLIMLPAFVALSLKLWLLFIAYRRKWADCSWLAFVAIFSTHNLSELVLLANAGVTEPAWLILRSYYICTLMVMLYGLFYVSDTSNKLQRSLCQLSSGVVVMLVLMILFTDSVVYGSQPHSYSLTAIKGEAFILFRGTALVVTVLTFYILIANYWRTKSVDSLYTLYALAPLVAVTLLVVALLNTPYAINSVVVVPLAGTLFLMVTLRGKNIASPNVLTFSVSDRLNMFKTRLLILRHCVAYARGLMADSDRFHENSMRAKHYRKPKASIEPLIQRAQSSSSANDDGVE